MDNKTPFQKLRSSKAAEKFSSFFLLLPSANTVAKRIARATSQVPFMDDVLAMYYCAADSKTPTKIKAAIGATLLYFVMPLDLIPDFLPMLGFGDDMTVLFVLVKFVTDHVTDEHREKAKARLETMGIHTSPKTPSSPVATEEAKEAA